MIFIVNLTLVAFAALMLLPALMLLIQCVLGAKEPTNPKIIDGLSPRPSVDVLIPAHNEAAVLAETIQSILPQINHADRLLVVADNCTDTTATLAKSMGAQVLERTDDARRAKGFAIAAGLDWLNEESRDVLVMIDADCTAHPDAIDILSRQAIRFDAPMQACYRMPNPSDDDGWSSVSGFAVTVKNEVRPLGLKRMGLGCVLTGSGMAFPSHLARRPNWASDNIVEDMKISYDLMVDGHEPSYCPDAIVTAALPGDRSVALDQRKRWEHGHLHTLFTQVPRLVRKSLWSFRPRLMFAAIDLMVPPLSLFVQIWLLSLTITAISKFALGLSALPLVMVAIAGACLFTAIMAAWFGRGREQLSPGKLCTIPFYVISKIPLYVTAVFKRQRAWKRTIRESGEATVCT